MKNDAKQANSQKTEACKSRKTEESRSNMGNRKDGGKIQDSP